ncbi:MAG: hypothetical protein ACI9T7_002907 [Oleiphilaceae bacterium]|jgi:hypothetical protein
MDWSSGSDVCLILSLKYSVSLIPLARFRIMPILTFPVIQLGDQLASRAEVKYNKGNLDKYDFDTKEWTRVFGDDVGTKYTA